MGYQITFVPTEEHMESYKPWKEEDNRETLEETIQSDILELISYCMKDHSKECTRGIVKQIKFQLKVLASTIENYEKSKAYFRWKENENHEFWYCGWEFAKDSSFEKDEIISRYTEDLTMLADVVKTTSWYTERDHFYDKWNELKDSIESGFQEIITDIVIHGIINDLKTKGAEKQYPETED